MDFNPVLIWFLVGLALILSEFMVPGVILVFFGMGAWITAIGAWVGFAPDTSSQLLIFAISSVILLVLLRRGFRSRFFGFVGDDNTNDSNIDEFGGQVVRVTVTIEPDSDGGQVEFKGANWKARSHVMIAAGQQAVVQGVDGITLTVAPAAQKEED